MQPNGRRESRNHGYPPRSGASLPKALTRSGVLTGLDPVVLVLRGRDGPDDVPPIQRPGGIANGGRSGPRPAQQAMQIHMPFLNLQQHLALAAS